jgi:hypothetical protein
MRLSFRSGAKPRLREIARNIVLLAAALWIAGTAQAFEGRIVDADRHPLADVQITLTPWNTTAVSDGAGRFRIGILPNALPGFRVPERIMPDRFRADREFRIDGRAAGKTHPWIPLFGLPPEASDPRPPLAKAAWPTTELVAEKNGYATARILVPESASALPDIILAPGRFQATVPSQPIGLPRFPAPPVVFDRGTSTDLPNVVYDPAGIVAWVRFSLVTAPGALGFVNPHTYFPDVPEAPVRASAMSTADDSGMLTAAINEGFHRVDGKPVVDSADGYGPVVTLLLWAPDSGQGYGAMKWMQFEGPVPSALGILDTSTRKAIVTTVTYAGRVPPLEICGRLSGHLTWKGAGAQPELWIGMLGTDFFAQVAADGSFTTTDLPAGLPPLAVVEVHRNGDGRVEKKTFYNLEGLAVSPGQTTLVEGLELTGPTAPSAP